MRYYEIVEDKKIGNVARLKNIQGTKDFFSDQAIRADFKPESHQTLVDYMVEDYPVVSDRMKRILEVYTDTLFGKRVRVLQGKTQGEYEHYWMIRPKILGALHEETEITPIGFIGEPVLMRSVVFYYPFFAVLGLKQNKWFARLDVVESLYRHGISGFEAKEVAVK